MLFDLRFECFGTSKGLLSHLTLRSRSYLLMLYGFVFFPSQHILCAPLHSRFNINSLLPPLTPPPHTQSISHSDDDVSPKSCHHVCLCALVCRVVGLAHTGSRFHIDSDTPRALRGGGDGGDKVPPFAEIRCCALFPLPPFPNGCFSS